MPKNGNKHGYMDRTACTNKACCFTFSIPFYFFSLYPLFSRPLQCAQATRAIWKPVFQIIRLLFARPNSFIPPKRVMFDEVPCLDTQGTSGPSCGIPTLRLAIYANVDQLTNPQSSHSSCQKSRTGVRILLNGVRNRAFLSIPRNNLNRVFRGRELTQ